MTALHLAPGLSIPHRALTRHIGIFGATGTGKTTTAAAIAERAPCPVILLDAKGDLESLGLHRPWRAQMRIDSMGADLVARALDLSPAQAGALHIALAWAEDSMRAVTGLDDLRNLLADTIAAAPDLSARYGLITPMSVAAIQRAILRLDRAAPWAFGANAIDWRDMRGINVYAASEIASVPGLYGAFVAHLLDSLYRGLGEIGDASAPGLMVMIDESHLIFDGAPPAVTRRIEQVTRLIRSKGVALCYITQSPADLPDAIAGQLASRVQHGLRASTPRQVASARAAAESMPGNATMGDVLVLGTGQALCSVPDARGRILPARLVQVTRGRLAMGAVAHEAPPARVVQQMDYCLDDTRRPWWHWPLIIAAGIYVPMFILSLLM